MLKLTLDTNCIIDLDEDRPSAVHIRQIVQRWKRGECDLAIAASSASERQIDRSFLSNIEHFRSRIAAFGLADLPLLKCIGKQGVSFYNNSIYPTQEQIDREVLIYKTLFPNQPVSWRDYAAKRQVHIDDVQSDAWGKWVNRTMDAQALWAHDHAGRDIFVTSDERMLKLPKNPVLSHLVVLLPVDAAQRLG